MIEVSYDTREIKALLKDLKVFPRALEKATSSAINKALVSTRAYMVKTMRADYKIKAGNIRRELHIKKSTWSTMTGMITGHGSPGIPLLKFVRGSKAAPSTRRLKSGGYRPALGVPVVIRKSRGKIPAHGVFLARMKSGHIGAYKRIGGRAKSGRSAINEVFGPSPIKILASDRYDERIEDFADRAMDKNLKHEADYVLRKMGISR